MRPIANVVLLGWLLLAGCNGAETQGELSQEQAIEIARNHISRHGVRLDHTRPLVRDNGSTWTVRFEPPPDQLGGGSQAEIDKQTGRVISARAEQ